MEYFVLDKLNAVNVRRENRKIPTWRLIRWNRLSHSSSVWAQCAFEWTIAKWTFVGNFGNEKVLHMKWRAGPIEFSSVKCRGTTHTSAMWRLPFVCTSRRPSDTIEELETNIFFRFTANANRLFIELPSMTRWEGDGVSSATISVASSMSTPQKAVLYFKMLNLSFCPLFIVSEILT